MRAFESPHGVLPSLFKKFIRQTQPPDASKDVKEDLRSPPPREVKASFSDTIHLLCPGDNANWTYSASDSGKEKHLYDENPKDNKFELKSVRSNDEGFYTCHYWDPLIGYAKDSFKLAVKLYRGIFSFNLRYFLIWTIFVLC